MSEEYEDMDDQCCDTDTGDCSPCIDSTDDDDDSSTSVIDMTEMLDTVNTAMVASGSEPVTMDELVEAFTRMCDDRDIGVVLDNDDGEIIPLNNTAEDMMEEDEEAASTPPQVIEQFTSCDCSTCDMSCSVDNTSTFTGYNTPTFSADTTSAYAASEPEDEEVDIDIQGVPYTNAFEAQDAEASTTLDMEDEDES